MAKKIPSTLSAADPLGRKDFYYIENATLLSQIS